MADEPKRDSLPVPNETDGNGENAKTEADAIRKQLGPELEILSREKRELVVARVQSIVESYTGPLPHPRHFELFEKALPGSADRIITMAEKEQKQRHTSETEIIKTEGQYALNGQRFALVIMLSLIGGAGYSIWMGSEIGAGIFLSAAAVSVVAGFLNGQIGWWGGTSDERSEPEKKSSPSESNKQKKQNKKRR
jgi:uncharacterized membrane protein